MSNKRQSDVIDLVDLSDDDEIGKPPPKKRKKSEENQKDAFSVDEISNIDTLEKLKKQLTCGVCLDSIKDLATTSCGHLGCYRCLVKAIKIRFKCPVCNRVQRPADIHRLYM
eukprot:TRINITY_DN778365_c0_g1_i1.p1 TRINITY_DN778365_c0_g1~~TRINITY_DN778365_c0_g1_i1.p1  ORF type:complete len:112 (-),score=9.93 TRINITY_DN778365_c0_g1_i1:136-471(-)